MKAGVAVCVSEAFAGADRQRLFFQPGAESGGIGAALAGHGVFVTAGVVRDDRAFLAHVVDAGRVVAMSLAHFRVVALRVAPVLGRAETGGEAAVTGLTADPFGAMTGVALVAGAAR